MGNSQFSDHRRSCSCNEHSRYLDSNVDSNPYSSNYRTIGQSYDTERIRNRCTSFARLVRAEYDYITKHYATSGFGYCDANRNLTSVSVNSFITPNAAGGTHGIAGSNGNPFGVNSYNGEYGNRYQDHEGNNVAGSRSYNPVSNTLRGHEPDNPFNPKNLNSGASGPQQQGSSNLQKPNGSQTAQDTGQSNGNYGNGNTTGPGNAFSQANSWQSVGTSPSDHSPALIKKQGTPAGSNIEQNSKGTNSAAVGAENSSQNNGAPNISSGSPLNKTTTAAGTPAQDVAGGASNTAAPTPNPSFGPQSSNNAANTQSQQNPGVQDKETQTEGLSKHKHGTPAPPQQSSGTNKAVQGSPQASGQTTEPFPGSKVTGGQTNPSIPVSSQSDGPTNMSAQVSPQATSQTDQPNSGASQTSGQNLPNSGTPQTSGQANKPIISGSQQDQTTQPVVPVSPSANSQTNHQVPVSSQSNVQPDKSTKPSPQPSGQGNPPNSGSPQANSQTNQQVPGQTNPGSNSFARPNKGVAQNGSTSGPESNSLPFPGTTTTGSGPNNLNAPATASNPPVSQLPSGSGVAQQAGSVPQGVNEGTSPSIPQQQQQSNNGTSAEQNLNSGKGPSKDIGLTTPPVGTSGQSAQAPGGSQVLIVDSKPGTQSTPQGTNTGPQGSSTGSQGPTQGKPTGSNETNKQTAASNSGQVGAANGQKATATNFQQPAGVQQQIPANTDKSQGSGANSDVQTESSKPFGNDNSQTTQGAPLGSSGNVAGGPQSPQNQSAGGIVPPAGPGPASSQQQNTLTTPGPGSTEHDKVTPEVGANSQTPYPQTAVVGSGQVESGAPAGKPSSSTEKNQTNTGQQTAAGPSTNTFPIGTNNPANAATGGTPGQDLKNPDQQNQGGLDAVQTGTAGQKGQEKVTATVATQTSGESFGESSGESLIEGVPINSSGIGVGATAQTPGVNYGQVTAVPQQNTEAGQSSSQVPSEETNNSAKSPAGSSGKELGSVGTQQWNSSSVGADTKRPSPQGSQQQGSNVTPTDQYPGKTNQQQNAVATTNSADGQDNVDGPNRDKGGQGRPGSQTRPENSGNQTEPGTGYPDTGSGTKFPNNKSQPNGQNMAGPTATNTSGQGASQTTSAPGSGVSVNPPTDASGQVPGALYQQGSAGPNGGFPEDGSKPSSLQGSGVNGANTLPAGSTSPGVSGSNSGANPKLPTGLQSGSSPTSSGATPNKGPQQLSQASGPGALNTGPNGQTSGGINGDQAEGPMKGSRPADSGTAGGNPTAYGHTPESSGRPFAGSNDQTSGTAPPSDRPGLLTDKDGSTVPNRGKNHDNNRPKRVNKGSKQNYYDSLEYDPYEGHNYSQNTGGPTRGQAGVDCSTEGKVTSGPKKPINKLPANNASSGKNKSNLKSPATNNGSCNNGYRPQDACGSAKPRDVCTPATPKNTCKQNKNVNTLHRCNKADMTCPKKCPTTIDEGSCKKPLVPKPLSKGQCTKKPTQEEKACKAETVSKTKSVCECLVASQKPKTAFYKIEEKVPKAGSKATCPSTGTHFEVQVLQPNTKITKKCANTIKRSPSTECSPNKKADTWTGSKPSFGKVRNPHDVKLLEQLRAAILKPDKDESPLSKSVRKMWLESMQKGARCSCKCQCHPQDIDILELVHSKQRLQQLLEKYLESYTKVWANVKMDMPTPSPAVRPRLKPRKSKTVSISKDPEPLYGQSSECPCCSKDWPGTGNQCPVSSYPSCPARCYSTVDSSSTQNSTCYRICSADRIKTNHPPNIEASAAARRNKENSERGKKGPAQTIIPATSPDLDTAERRIFNALELQPSSGAGSSPSALLPIRTRRNSDLSPGTTPDNYSVDANILHENEEDITTDSAINLAISNLLIELEEYEPSSPIERDLSNNSKYNPQSAHINPRSPGITTPGTSSPPLPLNSSNLRHDSVLTTPPGPESTEARSRRGGIRSLSEMSRLPPLVSALKSNTSQVDPLLAVSKSRMSVRFSNPIARKFIIGTEEENNNYPETCLQDGMVRSPPAAGVVVSPGPLEDISSAARTAPVTTTQRLRYIALYEDENVAGSSSSGRRMATAIITGESCSCDHVQCERDTSGSVPGSTLHLKGSHSSSSPNVKNDKFKSHLV